MSQDRLDELADRLTALSEELGDVGMDLLRSAIEDGESNRPEAEKRIARARRSVDKAAAILRAEP